MCASISITDLPNLVKSAVDGIAILHATHLGSCHFVKVTLKDESDSSCVKVGHLEYHVSPVILGPLQCHRCIRYGHVSAVCQNAIMCSHCAEHHAAHSCEATVLKCRNSLRSHDVASNNSPNKEGEGDPRARGTRLFVCLGSCCFR